MNIYTGQNKEAFPVDEGWVAVTLLANNPGLMSIESVPVPKDVMFNWLKQNCQDDVFFSYYDAVYANGNDTVSHFVVDVWFSDVNEAMMFKLTWA